MSPKAKKFWADFGANLAMGAVGLLLFVVAFAIVTVILGLFSVGQWVFGIIATVVILLGVVALKTWLD